MQPSDFPAGAGECLGQAVPRLARRHHEVPHGDHRPWYDRERPDPFASALRAVKRSLDARGILNPGVLIDP